MGRQKNDGRGRLGGRQEGTPNKATSTIRQAIADSWRHYNESGQFQKDLDSLKPEMRAMIMEKYAQYISPKMKSVDIDMDVHGTVKTIEDKLKDLYDDEEGEE